MTPRTREALASLAVYLGLATLWRLSGGRFLIAWDLWQFLPAPCLYEDLVGALLDLHAQPPLLNLVLGLGLKAAVATGTRPESWLYPLQLGLGAALVSFTSLSASRLVPRRGLRVALMGLLLANPYLYAEVHFFFYTIWAPCFLAATAWLALGYLERPGVARLLAALAPATLLVLTRSLYHPLWLAALLAGLAWHARGREPDRARAIAAAGLVVLLLASAWPLKNLLRFGFPGSSSWQGYNVSRGLPVDRPPALAAFLRRHSDPPAPEAARKAARAVPARFEDRPALTMLVKPDGSPNWNHYAVIDISRRSGEATLRLLRAAPGLLVLRAIDYYLNGWSVYEGRDVYSRGYVRELNPASGWARAYEIATMLPLAPYDPHRTRLSTGFALLFPLLVGAIGLRLWRRRRTADALDRAALLHLFLVVWVLLMVLAVDGAEGNRMRFDVQPSLWLLAGWTFGAPGRPSEDSRSRR